MNKSNKNKNKNTFTLICFVLFCLFILLFFLLLLSASVWLFVCVFVLFHLWPNCIINTQHIDSDNNKKKAEGEKEKRKNCKSQNRTSLEFSAAYHCCTMCNMCAVATEFDHTTTIAFYLAICTLSTFIAELFLSFVRHFFCCVFVCLWRF